MEYPPLWIWAIIIGIIIGTKLIIRWQATMQISRQGIDSHKRKENVKAGIEKNLEEIYNRNRKLGNIRSYKYGPYRLYKRRLVPRKD
jgi:hypothetical protein